MHQNVKKMSVLIERLNKSSNWAWSQILSNLLWCTVFFLINDFVFIEHSNNVFCRLLTWNLIFNFCLVFYMLMDQLNSSSWLCFDGGLKITCTYLTWKKIVDGLVYSNTTVPKFLSFMNSFNPVDPLGWFFWTQVFFVVASEIHLFGV